MNLCKCGCERETKWHKHKKKYNRFINGHNRGMLGKKHTDETCQKMAVSKKGKKHTEEAKKKMSKFQKGKKCTEETKRKISEARKGKIFSEVHCRNIALAKQNMPKKTRQKISETLMGHRHSKETLLKLSIAHMKCRTDGYGNAWGDNEYKQDCKKGYCEVCKVKEIKKPQKNGIMRSNLALHHIDFDKKNCCPDNLQTLCISCHAKLHPWIKIKKKKGRR